MVNNKNALEFFSKLIEKDSSCGVEKYGHDTTNYDSRFISKYINPTTDILDLGSGTGLIINKIESFVNCIDAIEPFKKLSDHIIKSPRVKVFNINVFDYKPDKLYDLITLFGFMHYFNDIEAEKIYKSCFNWAKKDATVIVKNQFGVSEDVNISGFSQELKSDYFAQYRYLNTEIHLLEKVGFSNVVAFDIYPKECNRWENTHFYAIVAEKKV